MQTPEKAGIQTSSATKSNRFEKEKIKQTGGWGECNYSQKNKCVSPLALHNKKVCQAPV